MTERALGIQISHFLKSKGVEVIFGIPGVHNQELYRGIEETGITHVLARHEQGVGFMADGYARASGKPGIAFVITGPGLCNIMTPMGQAYSDSVPLLVISSCLDETAFRRGQLHQMLDQEGAARTVCDWSETAKSYQAAYGLLERSFQEFVSNRPRPKHIQVPISVLEGQAPPFKLKNTGTIPSFQNKAAISEVAQRLSRAKRPLFILGGGAVKTNVMPLLIKCKAAAFSTFAGRGLVPSSYPLYFGSSLARPETAGVIATADLVIVLGSELGEVDLWRDHLGHKAAMVRVDIDPEVLSDGQNAEVCIAMRVEEFVLSLLGELKSGTLQSTWDTEVIKRVRKSWIAQAAAIYPGILSAIRILRDAMREDTLVYSDMTQFSYLAKEVWDMPKPSRWHHPYGFGTLGYALPAAIGGCTARPDLPVVAIVGDYGFQYTLPELGVAVELGLSLPIILWDNQKLKAIEDSMVGAQIAPTAVQAFNPDFCALANAYGAYSKWPTTVEALKNDLECAHSAGKPTLIYLSSEDFTD
ncbi:MAG: acetolactate synthase isozyme1 large subunit [Rhodobacteraceae bacterium]|nr:acetolactate synthase isozyme1 large subunit [Paracoccaceae bacterium]